MLHIVREVCQLRDGIGKLEYCDAVAGTHHLANKVRGSIGLEMKLLLLAEAGIHHQSQIERLLSLRLEQFDLLRLAFLINFKLVARKIRSGAIVLVQNAGNHADKINLYA